MCYTNAFNLFSLKVVREVPRHFPSIVFWFMYCYVNNEAARQWCNTFLFRSLTVGQQGDHTLPFTRTYGESDAPSSLQMFGKMNM